MGSGGEGGGDDGAGPQVHGPFPGLPGGGGQPGSLELLSPACCLLSPCHLKDLLSKSLSALSLLKYADNAFVMQELLDCELLLLSKLGWDVYLDCDQEPVDPTPRIRLNNLNFTETSR